MAIKTVQDLIDMLNALPPEDKAKPPIFRSLDADFTFYAAQPFVEGIETSGVCGVEEDCVIICSDEPGD